MLKYLVLRLFINHVIKFTARINFPWLPKHHEPALVIEWQGHTCPFLLDTKQLWHWEIWKSGPTCKETLDQDIDPLASVHYTELKPLVNSYIQQLVQTKWDHGSCTWQRSLSRETNTGTSKEIPAFNQSWKCRNHPTPNWSYKGHKVPYLVPRTADCLSPLWSITEHWPYAPGVCSVTGMSWRILHIWLIEYSLREKFPRLA